MLRVALIAALVLLRAPLGRSSTMSPLPVRRSAGDKLSASRAWTGVVVRGAGLATVGALLIVLSPGANGYDAKHHLPFRLLLAFLIAAALSCCWHARRHLTKRFWTNWWDPSLDRPDGSIDWEDVLEMTAGGAYGDPLSRPEVFRRRHFRSLALFNALCVASGLMAIVLMADGLLKWRLPAIVWAGPGTRGDIVEALANASGNLTAYLALLAATVSIIFTFRQLRAKVRADNRQAWINRARRLIARIVEAAEAGAKTAGAVSNRIELELMLNPEEKDHRLLTYLVQRLCRVRDLDRVEAGAHLRRVVRNELALSPRRDAKALLGILDENDPGKLVSYVVRLSHVLLKREWERVKHTR